MYIGNLNLIKLGHFFAFLEVSIYCVNFLNSISDLCNNFQIRIQNFRKCLNYYNNEFLFFALKTCWIWYLKISLCSVVAFFLFMFSESFNYWRHMNVGLNFVLGVGWVVNRPAVDVQGNGRFAPNIVTSQFFKRQFSLSDVPVLCTSKTVSDNTRRKNYGYSSLAPWDFFNLCVM